MCQHTSIPLSIFTPQTVSRTFKICLVLENLIFLSLSLSLSPSLLFVCMCQHTSFPLSIVKSQSVSRTFNTCLVLDNIRFLSRSVCLSVCLSLSVSLYLSHSLSLLCDWMCATMSQFLSIFTSQHLSFSGYLSGLSFSVPLSFPSIPDTFLVYFLNVSVCVYSFVYLCLSVYLKYFQLLPVSSPFPFTSLYTSFNVPGYREGKIFRK